MRKNTRILIMKWVLFEFHEVNLGLLCMLDIMNLSMRLNLVEITSYELVCKCVKIMPTRCLLKCLSEIARLLGCK
ncbi:hypothetical protein HanIR_Chr01g0014981 [Helianthus annuus]|nr:hypothetical protein HanIR_Chr01g0014981 [Helianthus annuus]